MQTERLIATGVYDNGRFGTNHVSLRRIDGGYVVRDHYDDGFFFRAAVAAKAAFRELAQRQGARVTLRKWAEVAQ